MAFFEVRKLNDLSNVIIKHFLNFPLLTQKATDFSYFLKIVELMKNKAHLNIDGLYKIINIKATMNLGLSEDLKKVFKNLIPVDRELILTNKITDPN
jgi:hypothetical protein